MLDLGADMEIHTQPELDTAVAMVVATVGNTVALMEVTIVAAQLADWLAGLLVARQALVAEVQAAAGTASTRHRLCLMLAVGWVITPRRQRTGMWDVGLVSLESCKCQSRVGQTIAVASSFGRRTPGVLGNT